MWINKDGETQKIKITQIKIKFVKAKLKDTRYWEKLENGEWEKDKREKERNLDQFFHRLVFLNLFDYEEPFVKKNLLPRASIIKYTQVIYWLREETYGLMKIGRKLL